MDGVEDDIEEAITLNCFAFLRKSLLC